MKRKDVLSLPSAIRKLSRNGFEETGVRAVHGRNRIYPTGLMTQNNLLLARNSDTFVKERGKVTSTVATLATSERIGVGPNRWEYDGPSEEMTSPSSL